MLDEVVEKRRPVREVVGVGIPVEPEIPLLKVCGHSPPVWELPAQPGKVCLAGLDDGATLRRHGDPLHAEILGLMQPAPEAEEDDARHRHEKEEAHPAELVGRAPRTGVDPDGKARAHELQRAVDIAGPLLKEGGEGQGGEDLQKQQQHAEGQPSRGGDPPLDTLLTARSFCLGHHGTSLSLCDDPFLTIIRDFRSLRNHSAAFSRVKKSPPPKRGRARLSRSPPLRTGAAGSSPSAPPPGAGGSGQRRHRPRRLACRPRSRIRRSGARAVCSLQGPSPSA